MPIHWDRGFYRNVVDLTDLGLRLGIREDGYYQVIEKNGDFSEKTNLVFPSHYEGIPIVGIGVSEYSTGTAEFSRYGIIGRVKGPSNEYRSIYEYYLEYGENYRNDSIDTIYYSTHHVNEIHAQNLVKSDKLKKIVYMGDINRNMYSYIPNDSYNYFNDDRTSIDFEGSLFDELSSLFNLIQMGYFFENNKNLVFVTTKEIKDAYIAFWYSLRNEDPRYTEEELIKDKIYEAVMYKCFEKWLVEPNICFYSNASETDGNIYWIDYEENGEIIYEPYEPYNNGKTFLGWYTEKECINKWNFNTTVELGENEVLNLYAKWGN